MRYDVNFRPQATRDMKKLDSRIAQRILVKIEEMKQDLRGDVKRLKDYIPAFRLRVGDYRVLFAVEDAVIIVYRVVHRREAYG